MESKLIVHLLAEHRVIERLLASLLCIVARAKVADTCTKPLLARHLDLFRRLLDVLHHGREEEILFESLHVAGMPREQGPIAVMLLEHERGRGYVATLGGIAASNGELDAAMLDSLRATAGAFAQLLSSHIAKEENVLYPMTYRLLDAGQLVRMAEADRQNADPRAELLNEATQLANATLCTNDGFANIGAATGEAPHTIGRTSTEQP